MGGRLGKLFSLVAMLASILGFFLSLLDLPDWGRLTLGLTFLVVLGFIGREFAAAKRELDKIDRRDMIDTGKRLICDARRHVVLFGDDMSWAPDYVAAIRDVTASGRRVTVVHTHGESPENARILAEGGARLVPVQGDPCLRGILADPADRDSVFFAAYKRRRHVHIESPSPDDPTTAWDYFGNVFDRRTHWVMVEAVAKLYRTLSGDAEMLGNH